MCRWLAYSGAPVNLEELLFKPANSLVIQSKHSKMGATTTNGDGFGVGWYGAGETPGVFRSTEPAWNDRNLRELSAHVASSRPGVRPHPRLDGIGGPADQLPPVPARHAGCGCTTASWPASAAMKRDLAFAVDPALFADIEGSTDSEMLFFLALTFGLEEDPPAAVARAVGLVEETARRHGIGDPVQMTVATTDGDTTWAFRYSSARRSRSLFHSTDVVDAEAPVPRQPGRCTSSPTTPVSWSPSRSVTSRAPGARSRSRRTSWCTAPARTSRRSRPVAP